MEEDKKFFTAKVTILEDKVTANERKIDDLASFEKLKNRLISAGFEWKEKEEKLPNDQPLNYNRLGYFFYDPTQALPEQYKSEIPSNKNKFIIPLNAVCTTVPEKFEAIAKTGNGYVYSTFDKSVQAPAPGINIIKDFTNYLIGLGKEVIFMVDDLDIKPNQYKLTTRLVEENLVKFRISYSDIVINPELTMNQFCSGTEYSYCVLIPVNDTFGHQVLFAGYSTDIAP